MKQITLIILAISFSMSLNAQEKEKQREIGITFSSFDNFGLSFKSGTANSLWRFNTILIDGSNSSMNEDSTNHYDEYGIGLGLGIGKEYRKEITENFELRYGADLTFSYEYGKRKDFDETYATHLSYSPGIHFVFGLNYVFNNFILGAEILPGFNFHYQTSKYQHPNIDDETFYGVTYGLSNKSILLSLAYRF